MTLPCEPAEAGAGGGTGGRADGGAGGGADPATAVKDVVDRDELPIVRVDGPAAEELVGGIGLRWVGGGGGGTVRVDGAAAEELVGAINVRRAGGGGGGGGAGARRIANRGPKELVFLLSFLIAKVAGLGE